MNPYKKIYAFGFMTIIHPSGQTDKITIEQLEKHISAIDTNTKDLKKDRKECLYDIGKISSKNPIKRKLIKMKVNREQKRTDNAANS